MARLLLSIKPSGPYEYSFDGLTETSIEKILDKYLRKYMAARRIRVNPLDKYERIKLAEKLREKHGDEYRDILVKITSTCNEKCRGEKILEEAMSGEKLKEIILEELKRTRECFEKCVEEVEAS